jgi:hypothetical protein
MRVVKQREGGIVRRVALLDDAGHEVVSITRFLSHLSDAEYSPNTVCAYAYDLRHLVRFLDVRSLGWNDFRPATALDFLGYLRQVPSARPAQRLGLTVATEQGRLLSAATVQRVLAATSSFFNCDRRRAVQGRRQPDAEPDRSRAGAGAAAASGVRRCPEPPTAGAPHRTGSTPPATSPADVE